MFEKFKELFSSQNLLETAYDQTMTMLEHDYKMYKAAHESLRNSDTAELPFDIKELDKQVNKYEREVRRNVLTHLTVAGTTNLVPGLVLVSIVVDVERIGDYCKNMVELAQNHPKKLHGFAYEKDLQYLEAFIEKHFQESQMVLKDQDADTARAIMANEPQIAKGSEQIVTSILTNPDDSIGVKDGAAITLYARYLKRINAHLTNVASAIVNPFPRIGFREKKKDD